MQDCKEHDILVATTTVATPDQARELARGLLADRLAACVQIDAGVVSVYRWEGQVCEEPELRLVIKTAPERAEALHAWLAAHHPYTLPQITTLRRRERCLWPLGPGSVGLSLEVPGQTPGR